MSNGKILAALVSGVVLAAVGVGLYLAGSPAEARLLRLDDRRIDDLRSISWAVTEFRRTRGHMPPALDSLPIAIGESTRLGDPATGHPYSYEITGDSSYSLCADFDRPSPPEGDGRYETEWRHRSGRFCFPRVVANKP